MGLLRKILKKPLNNLRGKIGELKVNKKLNPLLFKENHKLINNLTLIDENGHTHQIDHIEIRNNGIFCIETKSYSGLLFGNEYSESWTEVFYKRKYQIKNPIKQNKSHIFLLNKILNYKYNINSVIVLTNNNAKNLNINYVINLKNLKGYLHNFNDNTYLTDEEIINIYNTLLDKKIRITNKEHIENIKETQRNLKNGICPRCGGTLVIRDGKYGKFIGCSNYPKCQFTKKIDN